MNRFWFRKVAFNNDPPVIPPVVPPPPPPPPGKVTFTPEQQKAFDDAIAVERRKGEEKNSNLIKQYEALQKNAALTKEERETLQIQIDSLKTEHMTKEQLAAEEFKKKELAYTSQIKQSDTERDNWKNTFQKSFAKNEILLAAADPETEAYNGTQILDLLQGKAKVLPKMGEDGKPIPDEFICRIPMSVKDDKGEIKVLELTPAEALKRMMDMPEHGNLFKTKIKGGLGGGNVNGGAVGSSMEEALKDPAKYAIWRKEQGFTT